MKCTAKEFIELVRKMRESQIQYWNIYYERGSASGLAIAQKRKMRALERQVDEAEITDICNLETNQPLV